MPEEDGAAPFRETLTLLVGGGLATGALYLVGHAWIWGYYARMGVPRREFAVEPAEYVIHGFNESLPFFFAVAITALFVGVFFRKIAQVTLDDRTHEQHILAYCAIAGLMTGAGALIDVNTRPIVFFGFNTHVSAYQISVVVSTALLATLVVVAMTGTWGGRLRHLLGRSFSGHIMLAIMATIGLVGGASISGGTRASDELWNLADHREVTFEYVNGTRETYFFVAHANGAYYVRDVNDIGGMETGIIVISSDDVASAQLNDRPRN